MAKRTVPNINEEASKIEPIGRESTSTAPIPVKNETIIPPRFTTNKKFLFGDKIYEISDQPEAYYDFTGRVKMKNANEVAQQIREADDPETERQFLLESGQIRETPEVILSYKPGSVRGAKVETFNTLFNSKNQLFTNVDLDYLYELNDIDSSLPDNEKQKLLMSNEMLNIPVGSIKKKNLSDIEGAEVMAQALNNLYQKTKQSHIRLPKEYLDYIAYEAMRIGKEKGKSIDDINKVLSIMINESALIPNIQSASGALGLGQVVENTYDVAGFKNDDDAREIDKAIAAAFDIYDQKKKSLRYLSRKNPSFDNILRAYNAGEGVELQYMFGVPYENINLTDKKRKEVIDYPDKVKKQYNLLNEYLSKQSLQLGGDLMAPLNQEVEELESGNIGYNPVYNYGDNDISDFDFGDEDYYMDPDTSTRNVMRKGVDYLAYEYDKRKSGERPEDDKERSRVMDNLYAIQQAPKLIGKGLFKDFIASTLEGASELYSWVAKKTEGIYAPKEQLDEKFIKVGEGEWKMKGSSFVYDRDALRKMGYQIAPDAEDTQASKVAKWISETTDDVLYVPEAVEETLTGQVARGLGQAVGYIGSAPSALMKGGAKAFLSTTTVGAFNQLGFEAQELRDKKEAAASMTKDDFIVSGMGDERTYDFLNDNEYDDIVGQLLPGVLASASVESLGYGMLFKRMAKFNPQIAEKIKSGLGKYVDDVVNANPKSKMVGSALMAGFEGAAEEVIQDVILNVSASKVYDFSRSITDGLIDSATVGGTTSAVLQVVLNSLAGRRSKATQKFEQEQIDKAIGDIEDKLKVQNAKDVADEAIANGQNIPMDAAEIIAQEKNDKSAKKLVTETVSNALQQQRQKRIEKLTSVSNALSTSLGTNVSIIDGDSDPNQMIIDPVTKKRAKGVVMEDGTIKIDGAIADENTAIHEFGHIFLDNIRQNNTELYDSLIAEAKTKMPELGIRLEADYKDKTDNETATRVLEMYAAGKLDKRSRLYKIADQIWNYIKELIGKGINQSIVDGQIDFTKLDVNTTLRDIGRLLGDVAYQRKQVLGFAVSPTRLVKTTPDLKVEADEVMEILQKKNLVIENAVEENNQIVLGAKVDPVAPLDLLEDPDENDTNDARVFLDFLLERANDLPANSKIVLPDNIEQAKADVVTMRTERQYQIVDESVLNSDEYNAAVTYFQSNEFKENSKRKDMTIEDHIFSVMTTLGLSKTDAQRAYEAATGKPYNYERDPSQRVMVDLFRAYKAGKSRLDVVKRRFFDEIYGVEQYVKAMKDRTLDQLGKESGKEAIALLKTEAGKVAYAYDEVMRELFGKDTGLVGKTKERLKKTKTYWINRVKQAGLTYDDMNLFATALHVEERNERVCLMMESKAASLQTQADKLRADGEDAKAQKIERKILEIMDEVSQVRSGAKTYARLTQAQADKILESHINAGTFTKAMDIMSDFRNIVEKRFLKILKDEKLVNDERYNALANGKREGYPDFKYYVPMIIDSDVIKTDEGLDPATSALEREINSLGLASLTGTVEKGYKDAHRPLDVMVVRLMGTMKKATRNKSLRTLAQAIEINNAELESDIELAEMGIEDVILSSTNLPMPSGDIDIAKIERIKEQARNPRVRIVEATIRSKKLPDGSIEYIDSTPDDVKNNGIKFTDEQGNTKYIVFRDQNDMMKKSIAGSPFQMQEGLNVVANLFRHANNYMRLVWTVYNPIFNIRAVLRDFSDMFYQVAGYDMKTSQVKVAAQMTKNYAKALTHLTIGDLVNSPNSKTTKYWIEAQKAGMKMSWVLRTDHKSLVKTIQDTVDRLEANKSTLQKGKGFVEDALKDATFLMKELSDRLENIVRLAAYMTARENGLSIAESARIGKDVTVNFEQKGSSETIKTLSPFYLFIQPAIASVYKSGKTLSNPKQLAWLGATSALGYILRNLYHELGDDDEIRNSMQSEWITSNYSYLPTGGKAPIKLPKPYSLTRLFMNLGEGIADAQYGYKTNTDVMFGLMRDAMVIYDPVGGGSNELVNYGPPIAGGFIQAGLNRNYLGDPIVKASKAGLPNYLQPNLNTPEGYNVLAEKLYTGSAGVLDFNPSMLEFLSKYYINTGAIKSAFSIVEDVNEGMSFSDAAGKMLASAVYEDYTEDQKIYSFNFWQIAEKEAASGITQKQLETFFESAYILLESNRISSQTFNEQYMNILRKYKHLSIDDVDRALDKGVKQGERMWKKLGYKEDTERIEERYKQIEARNKRMYDPILEKFE